MRCEERVLCERMLAGIGYVSVEGSEKLHDMLYIGFAAQCFWYIKVQDMIGDRYMNVLTTSSRQP